MQRQSTEYTMQLHPAMQNKITEANIDHHIKWSSRSFPKRHETEYFAIAPTATLGHVPKGKLDATQYHGQQAASKLGLAYAHVSSGYRKS